MKAFLLAVVACVGISVAAAFILVDQSGTLSPARTGEDVRLK